MVDPGRILYLNSAKIGRGPIIYWMSRDQRVDDNWALLYAQETALKERRPLIVVFCLVPEFLGATLQQYEFMFRGLREVESGLSSLNIPLVILVGDPARNLLAYSGEVEAGIVVTDFDPLKIKRRWKDMLARALTVPLYEVDAHNIVPVWQASSKLEYGAYTIRPRIKRQLASYLKPFPKIKKQKDTGFSIKPIDWRKAYSEIKVDSSQLTVEKIESGTKAAKKALKEFIAERLPGYATKRNDPNLDGQSGLSPYLHFGQLSAQRVALEVLESEAPTEDKDAFLEELIIRRELADNFCFYNHDYDQVAGFPEWAQETLDLHTIDKREYLYKAGDLEWGKTHDPLWNAAQLQMVKTGKMHGYMRMYWAKKILEWTADPAKAMKVAIHLNDKYELDGRDPNGYAGIAWSIGGVHDRAWRERTVYGKIRYMSHSGARDKFDVEAYIDKWL